MYGLPLGIHVLEKNDSYSRPHMIWGTRISLNIFGTFIIIDFIFPNHINNHGLPLGTHGLGKNDSYSGITMG